MKALLNILPTLFVLTISRFIRAVYSFHRPRTTVANRNAPMATESALICLAFGDTINVN